MFTAISVDGDASAPITVGHFVPSYRSSMHSHCALSMARDAYWCAQQKWRYITMCADIGRIDVARNLAVRQARELKCDLLWMTDEDNWGAESRSLLSLLYETMTKHDAAVVGANYMTRDGRNWTAGRADGKFAHVFEADIVGAGLMLIDMRKLVDIDLPWFQFVTTDDGSGTDCPEDTYFATLVRHAGHRIIAHASVKTAHASEAVHIAGPHVVAKVADHLRKHPDANMCDVQLVEKARGAVEKRTQGFTLSRQERRRREREREQKSSTTPTLFLGPTAKW